ncbi:NR LBD domain-containing protein [Caenorhabditis elegans]|uniref:NR LBD domain-containing protein n=1 Tax=Caenorhabditis elegans TaxID=6239 RepID=B1Q270_CAEEL|nr:NR LBD domain-containing protein [Caenorhabditis elegans]CAQ16139.1 NR LBD domain-containing protein [Caenorhabditis elegans]|eukprot:NP_001122611.1 Uncharacterized protein CELE_F42G4.5 [Caenorhabditis elegans]
MIFGKKSSIGNVFYDVQCVEQEKKKSNSILRQLSQLSRRSIESLSSTLSSPRTPSPRATFSDYPNPCELILLSALQAHIISGDDMRNCSTEIQALTLCEKQKLINFFKPEGDASGIIENNAFKAFNCSNLSSDLLKEDGSELLEQLWLKLNSLVIPSLQSMCFPLIEIDTSFDVQTLILTAFRDRVLAKLLQDADREFPQLKSILLTILVETEDIPTSLRTKIDICLGKSPSTSKPRYQKKIRSKTDSCLSSKRKSVSWMDDMQDNSRKSSTFCA